MIIQTEPAPFCPVCGAKMKLRRPSPLANWQPFWGCNRWPDCNGSRKIKSDGKPEGDDDWDFMTE